MLRLQTGAVRVIAAWRVPLVYFAVMDTPGTNSAPSSNRASEGGVRFKPCCTSQTARLNLQKNIQTGAFVRPQHARQKECNVMNSVDRVSRRHMMKSMGLGVAALATASSAELMAYG